MIKKSKLSIVTGAGISVESGMKTFRGENGLWEGYDIMKVASIEGWHEDPELVLDFYNKRRAQLKDVKPNLAHHICAQLEEEFDVQIITQNVDNLHERAGSTYVLHLHGELTKIRSTIDPGYVISFEDDINLGDLCPRNGQLRPHIVWFGEEVPLLGAAAQRIAESDIVIIVGTSMQVYPAASIISYAPIECCIFYIDPDPQINYELSQIPNLKVISKTASEGMLEIQKELVSKFG